MDSDKTLYLNTQVGNLLLEFKSRKLCALRIDVKAPIDNSNSKTINSDKKLSVITQQLKTYFSSASAFESISLSAEGTEFQKSVWRELTKIPLGETRTYGEIAKILNSSARAVGNACRQNPIQIIVPCHRVVSAKGIGGYAGETDGKQLNIKRWLLKHEGAQL